jgi:phosphatidylinositol-3,4,5-trisphosphate 3-phosphatase/dual-specificity protein phosphatase PTEN
LVDLTFEKITYQTVLYKALMFDWLRRIVAGAKNRTVEGDYDLDLTYITDRIVAMAFPASGLEQTVRNCIGDVSSFLTEKH